MAGGGGASLEARVLEHLAKKAEGNQAFGSGVPQPPPLRGSGPPPGPHPVVRAQASLGLGMAAQPSRSYTPVVPGLEGDNDSDEEDEDEQEQHIEIAIDSRRAARSRPEHEVMKPRRPAANTGASCQLQEDEWGSDGGLSDDSSVSSGSSSSSGGEGPWHQSSRPTLRARGLDVAADPPTPHGQLPESRGGLQARVLTRITGGVGLGSGGGGNSSSSAIAAAPGGSRKVRRKEDDDDDHSGGASGRRSLWAGWCGKKELARCIRRRRRTLRTTLAALLGLYVMGLVLAAQGTWDPLNGEVPGGVPDSLWEAERPHGPSQAPPVHGPATRQEMRKSLPREAWLAAGLGEAKTEESGAAVTEGQPALPLVDAPAQAPPSAEVPSTGSPHVSAQAPPAEQPPQQHSSAAEAALPSTAASAEV